MSKNLSSFVLALQALVIFIFVGCGESTPEVDPDWRGVNIENDDPFTAVSDENITLYFSWQLNYTGTCRAHFTLYSDIPPTGLVDFLVSSADVQIQNSVYGQNSVVWNGRFYNFRQSAVPPGYYYIKIVMCNISSFSSYRLISIVRNAYDSDSDNINDAVELENQGFGGPVTTITYQGNTYYYGWTSSNLPPMISTSTPSSDSLYPNRGTHDYSLARGTITAGRLSNGLRSANSGTGYQYYQGGDPEDTDNWAILELVNFVERVARKWEQLYDYPIITSMDMSKQYGGDWSPDHTQHQKGLEADVRYIRSDNSSGPVNIIQQPTLYSRTRTQQLVDLFLELAPRGGVTIISGDQQLQGTIYDNSGIHDAHMHVWIADPDGSN